jgi:hypothetical protein
MNGSIQKGNKDPGSVCIGENFNYGVDMPTYPANTNVTFTWRWYESKNGDQIIPHEPGQYILKYHMAGIGYSSSVSCIFEIKER